VTFKAILFDLDGTLLDTLQDIAECGNRVLAARGLPTHPIEAYRTMVGDGVSMLVKRALPESHRNHKTIEAVCGAYRHEYGKYWNVHARAYDGIPELLDALTARGLRMAVLSNKPHEFTVQCVEQFLPRWRFDVVLGAGDRFPHKPDPASALHVAESLNILPKDILYLGDSDTDMRTAVAAGMYGVGAVWGFRTPQELNDAGAQALAQTPTDVLKMVQ
jgi:phosphoglycolate phosphatase